MSHHCQTLLQLQQSSSGPLKSFAAGLHDCTRRCVWSNQDSHGVPRYLDGIPVVNRMGRDSGRVSVAGVQRILAPPNGRLMGGWKCVDVPSLDCAMNRTLARREPPLLKLCTFFFGLAAMSPRFHLCMPLCKRINLPAEGHCRRAG